MRSASIQFGWFTPDEARRMLARMAPTLDSYGDRIALGRRANGAKSPPPLSPEDWREIHDLAPRRWPGKPARQRGG